MEDNLLLSQISVIICYILYFMVEKGVIFTNLCKKYLSRSNWPRVTEKEFVYKTVDHGEFQGSIGLIHIKYVKEPSVKVYGNTPIKFVDSGYYWLQFAPRKEHYWLTAAFNEKEEIVQYYIDITYENHLEDQGEAFFYDLFLDIVLLPDNQLFLLDEDELLEALNNHVISQADYDMAYAAAKDIMEKLKGRADELKEFCYPYFEELKQRFNR